MVAITVLAATVPAGCGDTGVTTAGTTAATTTATVKTTGAPAPERSSTSAAPVGPMTVLPFTGLARPTGVAVDPSGAVYVTDSGNNRVVKLRANSDNQTVLSFTGLDDPAGVAVDNVGNVYVTDAHSNRVLWAHPPRSAPTPPWQATSRTEWVGPFGGLQTPRGVAMNAGQDFQDFYVVDSGNNRVLHWKTGMTAPEVLAFTGLSQPDGIALDGNSNVWVTDTGNNRVLQLPSHSNTTQTALSFTGLNHPHGVAVGPDGVYVADSGNNRVLKLRTDPASKVTTLSVTPLTGLDSPRGVAVDAQGNLYVVDTGNNRVLRLRPA
ncbi:hypothetical protein AWC32_01060 [Mycobacterium xenopi]|nr:hypothetical protein AWC32_01060 [Mycobacterium xenopi]